MANIQLGGLVTVITPIQRTGSLRCEASIIGELRSQGLGNNCFREETEIAWLFYLMFNDICFSCFSYCCNQIPGKGQLNRGRV